MWTGSLPFLLIAWCLVYTQHWPKTSDQRALCPSGGCSMETLTYYGPFVRWIHPQAVDSPFVEPVMRSAFPCLDVIVFTSFPGKRSKRVAITIHENNSSSICVEFFNFIISPWMHCAPAPRIALLCRTYFPCNTINSARWSRTIQYTLSLVGKNNIFAIRL